MVFKQMLEKCKNLNHFNKEFVYEDYNGWMFPGYGTKRFLQDIMVWMNV